MDLSVFEKSCFQRAIELALEAENEGNLPIGAVISLEGKIIGEGKNSIWSPELRLHRHAEMEAMRSVDVDVWESAPGMTLYTTLEPCLMCTGAILLHGIGRLFYGSNDPFGGATTVKEHLPPFFKVRFSEISWTGPVMPDKCDELYERCKVLENRQ